MYDFKNKINDIADRMTANIKAANTIHPLSWSEYHQRRSYQNAALANCKQLLMELQKVVEIFEVDINKFSQHTKAINREIDLIKRWRQRDNKIKSRLQG